MEVNSGSERTVLDIPFLWLNSFFRGKYPNLITCSLLEGDISVT